MKPYHLEIYRKMLAKFENVQRICIAKNKRARKTDHETLVNGRIKAEHEKSEAHVELVSEMG